MNKRNTLKNSSLCLNSYLQTKIFERNRVEEEEKRKWRSITAYEMLVEY
jgi:hypothetical protein